MLVKCADHIALARIASGIEDKTNSQNKLEKLRYWVMTKD